MTGQLTFSPGSLKWVGGERAAATASWLSRQTRLPGGGHPESTTVQPGKAAGQGSPRKAVCVSYHGRRRGDGEPGLAEEEEAAGVFCYPLLGKGRL